MEIENILDFLYGERKNFKSTQLMRTLLKENQAFKETIIEGIKSGNVEKWPEELWTKLDNQNLRESYEKMSDAFEDGHNLGRCLVYSYYVSYSMPLECLIGSGTVSYLKGTVNSPEGKHTWLECKNVIYDTTFMICIHKNFVKKLGYVESFKTNPNKNSEYSAAKDFANDPFLRTTPKKR